MCGVIGSVDGAAGSVDLSRADSLMARRGPDALKRWISADRRVEVVHARLAIVDGGGEAHQPMTDPETGTTVAFNGEIYNYAELRAELPDYPYRTGSDTEAILAVYRRRGVEGFSALRGMFALVLVDGASGDVYLSRDPVGKKPLFITDWRGATVFGSSVQALARASGYQPAVSAQAVADYWTDGHVSPMLSVFESCRPIAPGETLILRRDGARASVHVAPPAPGRVRHHEAREALAELLRVSIQRRLRNNPHPVSLLSGGVDSTVVTSVAAAVTDVDVLTLGQLIPLISDERYARYAARRLDLALKVVSPAIGRLEDEVDFCMALQDEPLGMMSFLPLALLLRAVKPYGRILLTGDGGDEVFLGYGQPGDWLASESQNGQNGFSCGPQLPAWMSTWGRRTATHALVGHMFTKLDRASAEQGIEVRCPLLDWDVMAFARALDPQTLLGPGRPKHLLKEQLDGWPWWFVDRPKVGFAYHLRWAWAWRSYAGLRERILPEAIDTFELRLPLPLRRPATSWRSVDIWRHFSEAWRLLAWSAFLRRQHAR